MGALFGPAGGAGARRRREEFFSLAGDVHDGGITTLARATESFWDNDRPLALLLRRRERAAREGAGPG